MNFNKEPATIRGLFDSITPTYDDLNHLMSMSVDRMWRKQGLDKLDIKKNDHVLDIATGTGDMALQAASGTDCSIVGVDLSLNMLLVAEKKWDREGKNGTYGLVQGDALAMPFPDRSFDKAMVAYGIRNMVDISGFLDEVHRVLRPGGNLAILELSVPENPLLRLPYVFYLTKVLPMIGGRRSGNMAAYRYLSDSILAFPAPNIVEDLLEKSGFRVVCSKAQTFGACHLYLAERTR